jgi:valyl-tRNA synthetase
VICPEEGDPDRCPKCSGTELEQDPDVLDTWFSSALWPFSTLGWPEQTPELAYFYPTSVLVTGRDIIFFWVARMIFTALEFMQEVPFREVLIHGLVLDALGRKMSKSLGNGVDPLEVIDRYGADTLRFMLVTGNTPGNDLRFHWERVEGTRNFANKIWNASRFALLNLKDFQPGPWPEQLALADRWILSRYNRAVRDVTRCLEDYELGEAARTLYEFTWNELCDWYIELVKPRLYGKETPESRYAAQYTLWYVLLKTLELLHPFMPFLTEEIWQHLPHEGKSIVVAPWPRFRQALDAPEREGEMEFLMEVIRAIRNLRGELNIHPGRTIRCILITAAETEARLLRQYAGYIQQLGGASPLELGDPGDEKPTRALSAVVRDTEIYIPLAGVVDLEKEIERLEKEAGMITRDLDRVRMKLANRDFLAKAPPEVVEKERAKEEELKKKQVTINRRLAVLRA